MGIFNLAAETHVDRSIDNPDKFINSNILGLYNLIESSSKNISEIKEDSESFLVSIGVGFNVLFGFFFFQFSIPSVR